MSIIDDPTAWGGWTLGARNSQRILEALEERRPTKILEAGSGASTVVLGEFSALSRKRRRRRPEIISLESDQTFFDATQAMLIAADLQDRVDLRLVPLVAHDTPFGQAWWYRNIHLPFDIDFALIDGPPGHRSHGRLATMTALWDRLAPDFELWLDDAGRPGEHQALTQWKRRYDITVEMFGGAGRKQMARVRRR